MELPLQRVRLLLQLGDVLKALAARQGDVTLRGNYPHVARADAFERDLMSFRAAVLQRIRAEQGKRLALGELVPEVLDLQRGGVLAVSPQQRRQLGEYH